MKTTLRSYDVLILGGGVAACATAITLKNVCPKVKVAVVERKSKKEISTPSHFRIGETLSPHAAHTLRQMGIWETFQAENFKKSYGTSAAWGSEKVHHNEFIYSPFGYGWHLDRVAFDRLMIREARERGVRFYFETNLHQYHEESDHWVVKAATQTEKFQISAKFIVDATGKKAAFAMRQGANKHIVDQLVGIYRYYKVNSEEKHHVEGTYIESCRFGWWYSALLPNEHLVLAFMTDSDIANEHRFKKPLSFDRLLKNTGFTKTRTEATRVLGLPGLVAAHSQILDRVVGEKWLTVGDATMSYDPLSSLGIYKALSTNLYAAYAILDFLQGDTSGLAKYEKLMILQFKDYEAKRASHYAEEKRFERFPFWERRHKTSPIKFPNQQFKTINYETNHVH